MPACVLVKLDRTKVGKLPGLEEGVVPITPIEKPFTCMVGEESRGFTRYQLPMTGADAFTDYRSQGQTIVYVILDLATPPSGGPLTLFNLYVALSRSRGASTVRLLRDFSPALLMSSIDPYLAEEDKRLDELNEETKRRGFKCWSPALKPTVLESCVLQIGDSISIMRHELTMR
ncbi:hypothetical protein SCHPADRAFT_899754 [Schizopora paradoxa]|uniref:Uncharacterized protein n=1 Tax=Schizopora paradoxa TaxID=27342 RepID=A0A0H2S329_9AGAM|nr:hypothetical protein SCHPADRAFT_899754 [Schizopora paradoxa]